jgi:hypothetical protein
MLLSVESKAQAGIASVGPDAIRQAAAAMGVAASATLMNGNPARGFEIEVVSTSGLLLAAVAAAVTLRPTFGGRIGVGGRRFRL